MRRGTGKYTRYNIPHEPRPHAPTPNPPTQGRTQRGQGGGAVAPRNFQSNFFFYTPILDFYKVLSVNQKIMQLN